MTEAKMQKAVALGGKLMIMPTNPIRIPVDKTQRTSKVVFK